MVLIRDRSLSWETKQGLERRGFVIVDDIDDKITLAHPAHDMTMGRS